MWANIIKNSYCERAHKPLGYQSHYLMLSLDALLFRTQDFRSYESNLHCLKKCIRLSSVLTGSYIKTLKADLLPGAAISSPSF